MNRHGWLWRCGRCGSVWTLDEAPGGACPFCTPPAEARPPDAETPLIAR